MLPHISVPLYNVSLVFLVCVYDPYTNDPYVSNQEALWWVNTELTQPERSSDTTSQ